MSKNNASIAETKKQMEYYMGDVNLQKDDFFRGKIEATKNGFVELTLFLNCNKVKKMGISVSDIVKAVEDSTSVELNDEKTSIRRKDNKPLPIQTGSNMKKRDEKAKGKEEQKKGAKEEAKEDPEDIPVVRDELGRIQFVTQDFENTLIVHFETEDQDVKADEEYKVNWKDVEKMIKEKFDKLKNVYTRADKYEGDIAISSFKHCKSQFAELITIKDYLIGDKKFTFTKTEGEPLSEFWQAQGGHFQYCIAPKLRIAKKLKRMRQDTEKVEKTRKSKQSYTIAGVYYMDINKVKSKSRAILNNYQNDEKLKKADEEFIQDVFKFHDTYATKSKDFDHFIVGVHPDYNKTRCFFIVRKDDTKEDFSISKCIMKLESAFDAKEE